MIRNTVVNIVNYFYPLGNTPAVSLTQDLPPEVEADILLLGCGDARNILFTCFVDQNRRLDVTCCDIEVAILARNILLYTLLIDDVSYSFHSCIWNIYYHWKLDQKSADLLQDQLQKLIWLSKSLLKWRTSGYGETIRFCNERTFTKIRNFWQACVVANLTASRKSQRENQLQKNITKAIKLRNEILGEKVKIDGVSSVAPIGIEAHQDFATVNEQWWQKGITAVDGEDIRADTLNPTFLASSNDNVTLHYGINPLIGFPLAAAYIPLSAESRFHVKGRSSTSSKLVQCARSQFRAWAEAFNSSVSQKLILRFCLADALALSWTLQSVVLQGHGNLSANIACDNWTTVPLLLDEFEYGDKNTKSAPRRYDIVDTSNLIDHLGPLNLIPAMTGLLKDSIYSTMYTEALVQHDSTEGERIATLLGDDIRTVGLLFRLSPCEVWTNATTSAENESVTNFLGQLSGVDLARQTRQTRTRLRWKSMSSSDVSEIRHVLLLEPDQVVRFFLKLYNHMFEHENMRLLLSNFSVSSMTKRSLPSYNRVGFSLLLRLVRNTIDVNWQKCLEDMLSRIFSGFSDSPISGNFVQELLLGMHMLDIDTNQLPKIHPRIDSGTRLYSFFQTWPDVPTQVCVTLQVPRRYLEVFTSKPSTEIGTPILRCDIENTKAGPRSWSNSFASIQLAFGHATKSQVEGVPVLTITEDDATWWGQSDMFISTYVPSWILDQPGQVPPMVRCGILCTPQSTKLIRYFGISLKLFEVSLMSDKVVVSKFMPSMPGLPMFMTKDIGKLQESKHPFKVSFDASGTAITTLSQKILYHQPADKSALQDRKVPIQVQFKDSWRASIQIGDKVSSSVHFPIPVDQHRRKIRIARQSCYVEIEAPVMNPLNEAAAPFIYPMVLSTNPNKQYTPAPWTATHINLDMMPVIDLKDKTKLDWLTLHASMMFSVRERNIREAGKANRSLSVRSQDIRTEIKEGLFSMFMSYSGIKGQKARLFALTKQTIGVSVIIIPSCCRLDLINRGVVLDAAVIPLLHEMIQKSQVKSFYQSLTTHKFLQIHASGKELECWKSILPALAERCRTWKHRPDCEYVKKHEAPIIKGLEDGYSPLCSCGIGQFPSKYLDDLKINGLDYILKRHATRVAISPIFALPYVEDCFLAGLSIPKSPESPLNSQPVCKNCGSSKRKDPGSDMAKLLICGRCKQVRYCSPECQKADWKKHKILCSDK